VFAQTRTTTISIPDAVTTFKIALPAGTIICQEDIGILYELTAYTASTKTLTTATKRVLTSGPEADPIWKADTVNVPRLATQNIFTKYNEFQYRSLFSDYVTFSDTTQHSVIKFNDGTSMTTAPSSYSDTLSWLNPVLNFRAWYDCAASDPSITLRHIASTTGGGWTVNYIYECVSGSWVQTIPISGDAVTVIDSSKVFVYNGVVWASSSISSTNYWAISGNNVFNTNSGNVGIGKTDPTAKLDVNGSFRVNGKSTFNSYTRQNKSYDVITVANDTLNNSTTTIKPTSNYTGTARMFYNTFSALNIDSNAKKIMPTNGYFNAMYQITNKSDSIGLFSTLVGRAYNHNGYVQGMNAITGNSSTAPSGVIARTTTIRGLYSLNTVQPQVHVSSKAYVTALTGVQSTLNMGNYNLTSIDSAKGLLINPIINSRSGATTTIGILKAIDIDLSLGAGVLGVGTKSITNLYGMYLLNRSGLTGSSNHYGIYENFGKNYFTNTVYSLGGYLSDANGTSRFGTDAGKVNVGANNLFVGFESGKANTTGTPNTFIGYQSGYSNVSGTPNTFIGYQSGYSNTTGGGHVFLGNQAGYSETGSNKLYISNSNTATPLIGGDFSTNIVTIKSVLQLAPLAAAPFSGTEVLGMIYVNTDTHIYMWNGTAWKQLDN